MPILPKDRDPRLITVRRGGSLTDEDHRALTEWAARCAEHVLPLFERVAPSDSRPERAVAAARAWIAGDLGMMAARQAAFAANAAARDLDPPAKYAALSAGQAGAVPHVAAHDLGAAAYALRAVQADAEPDQRDVDRRHELGWQRDQLPDGVRALVLEDQRIRNAICWRMFDD